MTYRLVVVATVLTLMPVCSHGADDKDDVGQDRRLIQGTWGVLAYDQDGKRLPAEIIDKMSVAIKDDKIIIRPRVVVQRVPAKPDDKKNMDVKFTLDEGKTDEAKYLLDTVKKQKVIEMTQDTGGGKSRKMTGAYVLDGDLLTICIPLADHKVPRTIPTGPTAGLVRLVLKRTGNAAPDGK
jgi:uncharacterized protein (TIGR03067 family)